MNGKPSVQQLRRTKRRWLLILWCCGLLLALSVILGMGSTLNRLRQTVQLTDDPSLSEATYEEMIQDTLLAGKLGLVFGVLAFSGYLGAVLMHHRARQQLRRAREENRPLAIPEEEDHT